MLCPIDTHPLGSGGVMQRANPKRKTEHATTTVIYISLVFSIIDTLLLYESNFASVEPHSTILHL